MTLYTSLIAPTTNTDEWTMHGAWIDVKDPDAPGGYLRLRPQNGRFYSYSPTTRIGGFHSVNVDTGSYSKLTSDVLALGLSDKSSDETPVFRLETATGEAEIYHKNTEYMSFYGKRWRFTGNKGSLFEAIINGANSRFISKHPPGVVGGFYVSCPDADGNGPSSSAQNTNRILVGRGSENPIDTNYYTQMHADGRLEVKTSGAPVVDLYGGSNKGNLVVGGKAFSFHTSGNATAVGSWVDGSDANTKTAVATLDQGLANDFFLSRMKQLRPVTFKRDGQTETETGFLAQEVGSVLPSAMVAYPYTETTTTAEGEDVVTEVTRYGLRYSVVTANLVAAMKQLIAKVETLEAQVAALS